MVRVQATDVVPGTATGPHLTTSEICRLKREQAGQHAVRDAMAVAAALDAEIAHQGKPSAHVTTEQ